MLGKQQGGSSISLERQQYEVRYRVCAADVLTVKAVSPGVVVVTGETTGRYLAMNRHGSLYGSVSAHIGCCFGKTK